MPPRRRKRYRYRLRRLTPVGAAVLLAGLGGAWVGSRQTSTPFASAASAATAGAGRPFRGEAGRRGPGGCAGAPAHWRRPAAPHVLAEGARVSRSPRRREDRTRALGEECARAAAGRLDDEDHDGVPRAPKAAAARHRDGRQVGAAGPARSGRTAGRRAGPGVEALLLAASVLGQRRRPRTRDRSGRGQVDVHPVDERRGEEARPARHALLDAERRRRMRTTTRARGISPR